MTTAASAPCPDRAPEQGNENCYSEDAPVREPGKALRLLLLLAGILLGQMILYGPSLIGKQILLPLDMLTTERCYLPQIPQYSGVVTKDPSVSDLVLQSEPVRRFAVSELRAGRLPQWNPYEYGGAPFIAMPLLSPFSALLCSTPSPVVLAWVQMLVALVAGTGAYAFCRWVLRVGFWPAAFGAWLFPLTGFFVFWQGFNMTQALAWLPWLLLAVDGTVRRTNRWAPMGLAAVTCLELNTQLDVAGQALLTSGLYALWALAELYRDQHAGNSPAASLPDGNNRRGWRLLRGVVRAAVARLCLGWLLGFMLAAPYVLPVLAYTRTGSRMVHRASGAEERPPTGLSALPQLVLPDMYGTRQPPSLRYDGGPTQQESSAAGYAGLLTALVAAPLAFCSRRHRRLNVLWLILGFLALSWCLNVLGIVTLMRLPGLRMFSHNRWVFVDCFALVALGVTGLEALMKQSVPWRPWMWGPLVLLGGMCAGCALRSTRPIETVAKLASAIAAGHEAVWLQDAQGVRRVLAWFSQYFASAAMLAALGALVWLLLRSGRVGQRQLAFSLGLLQAIELIWFGYGRNVQCSADLYYPPIPVLRQLAQAPPGRVIGFACLPSVLCAMCNLREVRGYDAVDPARMVDLVLGAADPMSVKPVHARTMIIAPKATITSAGEIALPPVLDMLDVRYVIFRGQPFPNAHPLFLGADYWVLLNPRALPRAYVPQHAEYVPDDAARLARLEAADFDPLSVAFTETRVELPARISGAVEMRRETPQYLDLEANMQTRGLVVLADSWDAGWHAWVDGKAAPVLRVNHALRGVVVPAGTHRLEFRYQSAPFKWGLLLSVAALVLGLTWMFALSSRRLVPVSALAPPGP